MPMPATGCQNVSCCNGKDCVSLRRKLGVDYYD